MKRNVLNCFISVLIMVLFWSMMCVGVVCKSKDRPTKKAEENITIETTSIEATSFEEEREEKPTYETFLLTAYCSCEKCCGEWATKRPLDDNGNPIVYTASGTVATAGRTVAVDTSVLPFGTVLVIDGVEYVAEDRGGAIKGNRIDVYFDNHEDALRFGKQQKEILILK